jgi:hypothetical protein
MFRERQVRRFPQSAAGKPSAVREHSTVYAGDCRLQAVPVTSLTRAPLSSISGNSSFAVWAKNGASSSCAAGMATQVCKPNMRPSRALNSPLLRSEWTMPAPATARGNLAYYG